MENVAALKTLRILRYQRRLQNLAACALGTFGRPDVKPSFFNLCQRRNSIKVEECIQGGLKQVIPIVRKSMPYELSPSYPSCDSRFTSAQCEPITWNRYRDNHYSFCWFSKFQRQNCFKASLLVLTPVHTCQIADQMLFSICLKYNVLKRKQISGFKFLAVATLRW